MMMRERIIARLVCLFKGHRWEQCVIVPGQYLQAVTEVCARCKSGEAKFIEAVNYYSDYLANSEPHHD
jgi:hypothetical protein